MHRLSTSFVLGYHGCDRRIAEKLLNGEKFSISRNSYDWLGWGAYFWEANPLRGLEFAERLKDKSQGTIKEPDVIGAIIDLGFCLDLSSSTGVQAVTAAYKDLSRIWESSGRQLPMNQCGADMLRRDLDCAVINHLAYVYNKSGSGPISTVRGIFIEGKRIYENAGFFEKTHVQICVRDLTCIKGVFRVPQHDLDEDWHPTGSPYVG